MILNQFEKNVINRYVSYEACSLSTIVSYSNCFKENAY